MRTDGIKPSLNIKRWRLEKFDGEHEPGDGKKPVEIIEGGEGLPTTVTRIAPQGEQPCR